MLVCAVECVVDDGVVLNARVCVGEVQTCALDMRLLTQRCALNLDGLASSAVTRSKVVTTAELMAAGSVTVVAGLRCDNDAIAATAMVVTEGTLLSGLEKAEWMKAIVRAVAMVVARAEVSGVGGGEEGCGSGVATVVRAAEVMTVVVVASGEW
eukprot:gene20208-24192_t